MYIFAYALLLLALLCSLGSGGLALLQLWQGRQDALPLVERAHWPVSASLALSSALLLHALFWKDFSLQYVASYTDALLPAFYRLTAFWAGQQGSMLFWALCVALCGSIFGASRMGAGLSGQTRLWFWVFFHAVMAFFALVLTSWSNPFIMQTPVPPDGGGLNPLLQNPGMIIHPPLLFMGYAAFAVPSCLALAQRLSGGQGETPWHHVVRPFVVPAWVLLSAGIMIGAWWAYMELGWGGYWAWDPVENASLLPWLVATACLHTLVLENRRGKLGRFNAALMAMTTISAFFATWLTRSGVIDSVHAFGDGGVAVPLLVFITASLVVVALATLTAPMRGKPLANPASREGLLLAVAWILLSLALIILVATLWPVLSRMFGSAAQGLDASFYNRVCLPLGALLLAAMAFCPWFGWDGGFRRQRHLAAVGAVVVLTAIALAALGYARPTPLLAAAAGVGVLLGCGLWAAEGGWSAGGPTRAGLGAHLGMAVIALGMAFSGPYSQEREMILPEGGQEKLGAYVISLKSLDGGERPGHEYITAALEISKDGVVLGTLRPERRIYEKYPGMQFSEVDTIPGVINEVYASLLGLEGKERVLVQVSIKPLVNWIWLGSVLLCLLPLLGMGRKGVGRPADSGANSGDAGA